MRIHKKLKFDIEFVFIVFVCLATIVLSIYNIVKKKKEKAKCIEELNTVQASVRDTLAVIENDNNCLMVLIK